MNLRTGICLAQALVAAIALGACTRVATVAAPEPEIRSVTIEPAPQDEWRGIAHPEDTGRVERIKEAWTAALADARRTYRRAIQAEGELLEPDAALPRPAPPPGPYHCRTIKLGRQGRGSAFVANKPFFCYVEAEGELLSMVKQTGSERPVGRIYPDSQEARLIFLGSLVRGKEGPRPYNDRRDRDLIGLVERVAPFRYRLVIPWPRQGSKLEVIELIPVTG